MKGIMKMLACVVSPVIALLKDRPVNGALPSDDRRMPNQRPARAYNIDHGFDRKGVTGQGRIRGRYFRKLEANRRMNGLGKLFPVK